MKQLSTSNKDNWESPVMLTVHWDSKLTLSVMTPNKSEERLAVSVGNSSHHVGQVVLDHVFTDLKIEASKSQEVVLFSRFKKNFPLFFSCGST
jgi:hypothetical protein